MKRLVAVLGMVLVTIALAACAAPGSPKKVDAGWVSLEVPAGYTVVEELPHAVTLSKSPDTRIQMLKIEDATIVVDLQPTTHAMHDAEAFAQDRIADGPERYADKGTATYGDLDFHFVQYEWGPYDQSWMGFADAADGVVLTFRTYLVDLEDPAVQSVLASMSVDESKLPQDLFPDAEQ